MLALAVDSLLLTPASTWRRIAHFRPRRRRTSGGKGWVGDRLADLKSPPEQAPQWPATFLLYAGTAAGTSRSPIRRRPLCASCSCTGGVVIAQPRTEVGGPKAAKEAANRRRTVARSDAFGRPMRANGTFSKRNPPAAARGTGPAVGRRGLRRRCEALKFDFDSNAASVFAGLLFLIELRALYHLSSLRSVRSQVLGSC